MRRASLVVVAAAVFAVQSCGGSSSSPYGMNTGPAGGGGGGGGGGTPLKANVSIIDYSFGPSNVVIAKGGSVTWTNDGAFAHTVTADSGGFASGQLAGSSAGPYGGGAAGGTFTWTFLLAGTYTYHCSNHATMTGTVTVQ